MIIICGRYTETKRFTGNQRTASLPQYLKCIAGKDNACWLPYRLVSVSIGVLLIYTVYYSEIICIASLISVTQYLC